MAKEKQQLKNKKIWKWTIINLAVVSFGASVITNITYLPKYFMLKHRSDITLNIHMVAYGLPHNETEFDTKPLLSVEYQSTMATVGDLMASYNAIYKLENNGALGRGLIAIWNEQINDWLWGRFGSESKHNWAIYYNGVFAPVGIDSLYLSTNDKIELYYENNY